MCGVIGLSLRAEPSLENCAQELATALLMRLQHRGQDGAGLSVLTPSGEFQTSRGLGLIEEALHDRNLLEPSRFAIAHTRYATTGTGGVGEVQPFIQGSPRLAMAHNGNIVNVEELCEKYKLKTQTASDLDVLLQIFLLKKSSESFLGAIQNVFDTFNGSYAVVGLDQEGSLFGFRDPFGIRPLYVAESLEGWALASETCALSMLSEAKVSEIEPGGWVKITSNGQLSRGVLKSQRNPRQQKRYCQFENVYFSSPQSEWKERSVYRLRFRLGEELAQEMLASHSSVAASSSHLAYDYVVPVPDTSRAAALAVAEKLGVPYREFLVKNNYVPRTFILGSQRLRLKALANKLSLIGPEIKSKKILLVDDSVVRGNTSRLMTLRLREAGAQSVGLASTCPPIRHGCYYGIDFPDPTELVAHERDVPAIAKELGVDELFYISLAGLERAFESTELCTACLTGNYPTRDGSFERFLAARRQQRGTSEAK